MRASLRPLKGVLESLLGSEAALAAGRLRRRGSRLVLAYHNVIAASVPPPVGEASLHLPLATFTAQLDAILATGLEVVPIDHAGPHPGDTPQVAITFDDAYADSLALAVPALAERRMPATVFVAPGMLGSPSTWWDRLAKGTPPAVDHATRESALWDHGGAADRILAAAPARRWPVGPLAPEQRIAVPADLDRALACHPGLSIGPHTMSHPNLMDLPATAQREEIATALHWLMDRWPGRVLPWLAYPYGMASDETRSVTREAGYSGAMVLRGSWHDSKADRFAIPRLNVTPGLSSTGFRSRLAGIF